MDAITKKLEFGNYALIEQKRYGCANEWYLHKVIGRMNSNNYVDVPVQSPAKNTIHNECVDVITAITCGVCEETVLRYKEEDVRRND